jgi:hypothetical protein
MAYFAEINNDNIVIRVLAVDNSLEHRGAEFLTNDLNLGGTWIQTSYNTQGNINSREGGVALHKNYAGIGYTWDGTGFAAPQPYASWTKDADTYLWEAPVAMPTDGRIYSWDEATTSWVEAPAL